MHTYLYNAEQIPLNGAHQTDLKRLLYTAQFNYRNRTGKYVTYTHQLCKYSNIGVTHNQNMKYVLHTNWITTNLTVHKWFNSNDIYSKNICN